jgi:hypothetical protein
VDISPSSTSNTDKIIKFTIPDVEKQMSHKTLEDIGDDKMKLQRKESPRQKLHRLLIHSNLLKHQNWMYKECTEHLTKSKK